MTICANCSHPESFHCALFGYPMGCDFCVMEAEMGYFPAALPEHYPGNDEDRIVYTLCGCDEFVPVQVGAGAEVN